MTGSKNNTETVFVVSEIELVYRSKIKASDRPVIRRSQDAYAILMASWDRDKIEFVEQFKVLYVNCANKVLGMIELSTGGLNATVADPRLIFASALKLNATALILCHNHPSGNILPSEFDKALTEKIKNAGRFLDIRVSDHIILTPEYYFSFADEGLI